MEILEIIITGVFSLSVALSSIWLKHILEVRSKNKEKESRENLSNDEINIMFEIQVFLNEFIKKNKLDRLCVFQFHNGGTFFKGIPMRKYSQTFEALGCGVAGVKKINQDILITEDPLLIKILNENDFFVIDGNDEKLDYIRNKIEENGILQMIIAPIRTLSGQLIGFIQIHSVKHKIEITEDLKNEVLDLVLKLSGYLIVVK